MWSILCSVTVTDGLSDYLFDKWGHFWGAQKYEQSYVCLIHNTVFTKNVLRKTCFPAVRELADKEACGPVGQSLPPHCQRGKQQEECLLAEGGPSGPHAVQTRGVRFGSREAGDFHSHTCIGSLVLWCETHKCATKCFSNKNTQIQVAKIKKKKKKTCIAVRTPL